MAVSIEEVRKIACLARIKLTPEEEHRHAETISVVLDYMKLLNEVDTTGVEPTAQVTGLSNVFREDVIKESGLKEELKNIWLEKEGDELKVPAVFNEDEEE
jgi:aspartyl-tRNA(Asn)/glutamyl-tRNA(Gln) amidotransferase subunit C